MGWWHAQRPELWTIKKKTMTSSQTLAHRFAQEKEHWLDAQRWFSWQSACQTESYGQHGRVFHAPVGGLYTTLLFKWPCALISPLVSGVCALAILKTFETILGHLPKDLTFKWTNDIYFEDKKLAGVLVESIILHKMTYAVIGFGLNINTPVHALEGMDRPISTFREVFHRSFSIDLVADILRHVLFESLKDFFKRPEPFLPRLNARLAYLNELVYIQTPQGWFSGIFEGVNALGQVCLKDQHPRLALSIGKDFETLYSKREKPL